MTVRSHPVNLDPDSLYLVTRYAAGPLDGSDVFNWSIYHVGPCGDITAHEWKEVSLPFGRSEAYTFKTIQAPSTMQSPVQESTVVGYFKLEGYTPITRESLTHICESIFKPNYATKEANRLCGVSSDTWLLGVLNQLKDCNYLVRSNSESLKEDIIAEATRRSSNLNEQYLQCFLNKQLFHPENATI